MPDSLKSDPDMPDSLKSDPDMPDSLKSDPDMPDSLKSDHDMPDSLKSNSDMLDVLKSNSDTLDVLKFNSDMLDVLKFNSDMLNVLKSNSDMPDVLKFNSDMLDVLKFYFDMLDVLKSNSDMPNVLKFYSDMLDVLKFNSDMLNVLKSNYDMPDTLKSNYDMPDSDRLAKGKMKYAKFVTFSQNCVIYIYLRHCNDNPVGRKFAQGISMNLQQTQDIVKECIRQNVTNLTNIIKDLAHSIYVQDLNNCNNYPDEDLQFFLNGDRNNMTVATNSIPKVIAYREHIMHEAQITPEMITLDSFYQGVRKEKVYDRQFNKEEFEQSLSLKEDDMSFDEKFLEMDKLLKKEFHTVIEGKDNNAVDLTPLMDVVKLINEIDLDELLASEKTETRMNWPDNVIEVQGDPVPILESSDAEQMNIVLWSR
jgi:hypothetical protein